jgi:3-deoxy-D-manno-octulosonic-acid transferase
MLQRLWRPILGGISRVLAQTETDAVRLRALGCRPDAVTVAGNLKFDVRITEEAEATRLLKAWAPPPRFLVAGSTLEGEEAAIIATRETLAAADPALVIILAPRHPERFAAVAALLEASRVPWIRRSEWKPQPSENLHAIQVVLLDTIGELASVYSVASVALVGGSLVPAGGHNPLEPAQFGVPIVMGPHYANFRAITDDLLAHQAIRIVPKEELAPAIVGLLSDPAESRAMGGRARQVFEQQAGATGRCVDAIRGLLGYSPKASVPAQAPSEHRA